MTAVTLESLRSKELISPKDLFPSQLGRAVVWSGLSPLEGQAVYRELEKARMQLNLENELHMLYLVTPLYLIDHVSGLDWYHYLQLWGQLPDGLKRVGNLVGVDEARLASAVRGRPVDDATAAFLRRFYW